MDTEEGYIYCISNLDIMPNIYKVGVTLRSPLDRLKEANSSDTWKIPYYKIEIAKKVNNPKYKEKTIHRLMEKFMVRIHPKREFFRGELSDIKEIFNLMDGTIWNETPPVEIIDNRPISIEGRLSEDPDIRVKQLIELINLVFENNTVKINENGLASDGLFYYSVTIDKVPIIIIENHNIGRAKIAMFTTNGSGVTNNINFKKLKDYYDTLDWEQFGNSNTRKKYDTEGKTKQEIINILEGFKNIIPSFENWKDTQNINKIAPLKVLNHELIDKKKIIWSNEEGEITDRFNNTYSFGKPWRNNQYIKVIIKNGSKFTVNGGVHRGYSIWLDYQDIIHISHGRHNIHEIQECIFNDNTITDNWRCSWKPLTEEEVKTIHNHFGI